MLHHLYVDLGIELDNSITKAVAENTNSLLATITKLDEELTKEDFANTEAHLRFSADVIRPLMDEARVYADALELLVADELWPLPKYQEMLFIK